MKDTEAQVAEMGVELERWVIVAACCVVGC